MISFRALPICTTEHVIIARSEHIVLAIPVTPVTHTLPITITPVAYTLPITITPVTDALLFVVLLIFRLSKYLDSLSLDFGDIPRYEKKSAPK